MSIAAQNDPRISSIDVTDEEIVSTLVDGRRISVPLVWSWRLSDATTEQRNHYELIGSGEGVHWLDLSAKGMLSGQPAKRPLHPVFV